VPVFRVPSSLDDDVVWSSKKETIFSEAGTFLPFEDSPLGLVDDLAENADGPFEPPGKLVAGKGIFEVMGFLMRRVRDCRHRITPCQLA